MALDAFGRGMLSGLRNSTRRRGSFYEGVLRDAKNDVVWACGHNHRNRDQDWVPPRHWDAPPIYSANTCARRMLTLVEEVL